MKNNFLRRAIGKNPANHKWSCAVFGVIVITASFSEAAPIPSAKTPINSVYFENGNVLCGWVWSDQLLKQPSSEGCGDGIKFLDSIPPQTEVMAREAASDKAEYSADVKGSHGEEVSFHDFLLVLVCCFVLGFYLTTSRRD